MKHLDGLWNHLRKVHFSDASQTNLVELERLFRVEDETIVHNCGVAKGEILHIEDITIMLVQTMKQAFDTTIAMYQSEPTELEKEAIREVMIQVITEGFNLAMQELSKHTLANTAAKAH